MRQYAGFADRRRDERALPLPARAGPDRPVGRVRPADPDGLRLATRPRRKGRSGGSACPIASLADMETLLAGIPLGEVTTSMTINATAADPARALRGGRRAAGRRPRGRLSGTVQNDILKEYIARGTWIYPPRAVDAPRDRRVRVRGPRAAPLEHDLHHRLPHARGGRDGGPGARVHARRRDRLRRGGAWPGAWTSTTSRRRLSFFFAAWSRAVRGGRQVPGGAPDVGPDHARAVRRIERPFDDVPVPRPDGRAPR